MPQAVELKFELECQERENTELNLMAKQVMLKIKLYNKI